MMPASVAIMAYLAHLRVVESILSKSVDPPTRNPPKVRDFFDLSTFKVDASFKARSAGFATDGPVSTNTPSKPAAFEANTRASSTELSSPRGSTRTTGARLQGFETSVDQILRPRQSSSTSIMMHTNSFPAAASAADSTASTLPTFKRGTTATSPNAPICKASKASMSAQSTTAAPAPLFDTADTSSSGPMYSTAHRSLALDPPASAFSLARAWATSRFRVATQAAPASRSVSEAPMTFGCQGRRLGCSKGKQRGSTGK
mmetsp:Transcript_16182/g.54579  ORF Transcript_16182/g.54579 Transcript_16182/m.54579 type:complete len:259 (-) Transcript_16182:35-811(-)